MERERKRTQEEEEELDRIIAQIREKNQKIVERTKEVEEDRAQFEGLEPRKAAKTSVDETTSSVPKKGEWSREWDHGKTSADTWRENVPSIELSNRLAGRGGGRGKNGGGRGNSHNNSNGKQRNTPDLPKGSRLEGRLVIPSENKERDNQNSSRGGKGGRQQKTSEGQGREVIKKGKDLKIKIVNDKVTPGGQPQNQQKQKQQRPKKENNNQKQTDKNDEKIEKQNKEKKPRPENDRNVIRSIIKKTIDKIEYLERCEKRKLKNEAASEDIPDEAENEQDEVVEKEEEVEKKNIEDNKDDSKKESITEEVEIKEKNILDCSGDAEVKAPEKCDQDANQNVIKVVKEKILTLEVSS